MKVRVEYWQAVWERTTADVEIPDDELTGEYADPDFGLRDWIEDNWNEWVGDAYTITEMPVESMDTELSVEPLEETNHKPFMGEGT